MTGISRRTVNIMHYLMQHDAHHRGQLMWLARNLGHEFVDADAAGRIIATHMPLLGSGRCR